MQHCNARQTFLDLSKRLRLISALAAATAATRATRSRISLLTVARPSSFASRDIFVGGSKSIGQCFLPTHRASFLFRFSAGSCSETFSPKRHISLRNFYPKRHVVQSGRLQFCKARAGCAI